MTFFAVALLVMAVALLVMALAVFGLQALYFLKEGGMLPVSLLDGLQALQMPWISDLDSLGAMHEVLKSVPLSLVFLFFAALCYFGRKRVNSTTIEKANTLHDV